MLRRLAKWLGLCLGVALALLALLLVSLRQPGKDPLAILPQGAWPSSEVSHRGSREDGRLVRQYTMRDAELGAIAFVVSLPEPLPDRALPIVVVLGGLETGLNSIRHLPPAGNNVVVGFDWPIPDELPEGVDFLLQGPALYRQMLTAPGQIAAAVGWVAAQSWARRDRISILAFSLGALAAPAAQRLLEAQGVPVGWTVLAYGGADIGNLLRHHPSVRPDWLRPLLGWSAGWLFRPLDPAAHLPHLSGRFLLIAGTDDGLVPEESARLLQELAPEPKAIVRLGGGHIGVGKDQAALRERILKATEAWLTEQGAVNSR